MEEYLTKDEKELLSLVNYFRKHYENFKRVNTTLSADDIKVMNMLDEAAQLCNAQSKRHKAEHQLKFKPKIVQCPECSVERERIPLYEEKNEEGLMCFVYHCFDCNIDFIDFEPNNAADQLIWLKNTIDITEKYNNESVELPEDIKKAIIELKKKYDVFQKAFDDEAKTFEEFKKAEDKPRLRIRKLNGEIIFFRKVP